VQLTVLTWNLMHGRSIPPVGGDLMPTFASTLAGWEWDVALLQEVPPWWPPALAHAASADSRTVLTSRNALLPLRRAVAVRWPDVIKSNGGGANAILVRRLGIAEHRTLRLCWWPERRWLHAVRLAQQPMWIGNLHATVHNDAKARREGQVAETRIRAWAGGLPVALGGDFNIRQFEFERLIDAGGNDVDHVFVDGLDPVGDVQLPHPGELSDHAPVRVTVAVA
jgi:endonuclease/exonuclease/phosphatase family metal-dependent hydrolase